jgi:hypothetical protein
MPLRWPFSIKPVRPTADEHVLSSARAEFIAAEAALDLARTRYLRLRNSRQPTMLRLHQSALDHALHRYHTARHVLRALEQTQITTLGPWRSPTDRAANEGPYDSEA